jgi:hypothetical protein
VGSTTGYQPSGRSTIGQVGMFDQSSASSFGAPGGLAARLMNGDLRDVARNAGLFLEQRRSTHVQAGGEVQPGTRF